MPRNVPPGTFERYPEVSPDERVLSDEDEAQMAELKRKLGLIGSHNSETDRFASHPKTTFTPRTSPKPIEEQKASYVEEDFSSEFRPGVKWLVAIKVQDS